MASVAMSSDIASRCMAAGVPVVLFNRSQVGEGLTSVTSANTEGGRQVAEFLLAAGHERFGYIAGWEGASTQIDRESGFRATLRTAGTDIAARGVGNFQTTTSKMAARAMFDTDTPPSAVFVANDHMALAVLDVLRSELGLDVPGDVSVVGYDDAPPAAWAAYDLTTVRQRASTMVDETVQALLQMIDGTASPRHIEIDGPLIVRGSARLPDGWSRS